MEGPPPTGSGLWAAESRGENVQARRRRDGSATRRFWILCVTLRPLRLCG